MSVFALHMHRNNWGIISKGCSSMNEQKYAHLLTYFFCRPLHNMQVDHIRVKAEAVKVATSQSHTINTPSMLSLHVHRPLFNWPHNTYTVYGAIAHWRDWNHSISLSYGRPQVRMLNCISNSLPPFNDEELPTDSILNYPEAESPTTLATAEASSPCYPQVESPLIASTDDGPPWHPE